MIPALLGTLRLLKLQVTQEQAVGLVSYAIAPRYQSLSMQLLSS